MHEKYVQKFAGGAWITLPPLQKLYPHGLAGAPHVFGVDGAVGLAGGVLVGAGGSGVAVAGGRATVGTAVG